MTDTKSQLEAAKWILERTLAWIAAAEVKVGVIVAIDTAMLAGLSATFGTHGSSQTPWSWLLSILAAAALLAALFCAAMAVLPRLNGPLKSLLFFGCVGKYDPNEYIDIFKKSSDDDLLEDWLLQIHRNAEIACDKFAWVRAGMLWSFVSVIPWLSAIIAMLK